MLKYDSPDPFPLERDGRSAYQRITCQQCGNFETRAATHGPTSPQTLDIIWRKRGWDIDLRKGRFMCAACVKKETLARRAKAAEHRKEREPEMQQHKPEQQPALAIVPPSPPSQSTALAKKIMSDLLFEHYDLDQQNYKDGWDDKRIAEESGLSETFVAQRRSSDYGPMKPKTIPPIHRARSTLTKAAVFLEEISKRVKEIDAQAQAGLEEIQTILAALNAEIGAASQSTKQK